MCLVCVRGMRCADGWVGRSRAARKFQKKDNVVAKLVSFQSY